MKINVQKLEGPWDLGYVLDMHVLSSTHIGNDENGKPQFDTKRTEVGEAVFQMKYRSDLTQVDPIASQIVESLVPYFKNISFIVPIPPSKQRKIQPVIELAKRVAAQSGIPCSENLLVKTGRTPQMKDIALKDEKLKALGSVFKVQDVLPKGSHNILLVDDLYDSGSSLEAACVVLRQYPKIRKIFVATATRTK